jgi:hypothetical protein
LVVELLEGVVDLQLVKVKIRASQKVPAKVQSAVRVQ